MSVLQPMKMTTRDMVHIAMCTIMIVISSWLIIPTVVPFTLQTLGVFLTIGILGGKKGSFSVLLYILLGVVGLPVFSGFTGGIGSLIGATGGYIIGFLLAALLMWAMEYHFGKKQIVLVVSMFLGMLLCYCFGTMWFVKVYATKVGEMGLKTAFCMCVLPYMLPDILKIMLALNIRKKLIKVIRVEA